MGALRSKIHATVAKIVFAASLCLCVESFLLSAQADVLSPLTPVESAFRRALSSSANWTMERRIAADRPPLVSSGTVTCVAKSGIVWRVERPFASSVAMTTNAMVFTDEDGVRVKPLADLPHYADIREKTDAFVAGDAKAFDGLFEIDGSVWPDGGWRLVLKPEVAEMRRYLFSEIDLTGAGLPTNAVLKTADGGTCAIRFSSR